MQLDEFIPFVALFIPIIAIVMGIGLTMLITYLHYRKRRTIYELYHAERMAAIDKGLELPPVPDEFFSDGSKAPSPHGTLLGGLIFTFTGIGLLIALYSYHRGAALYALIPIFFGLAFLVYYFAVGRKAAQALETSAKGNSAEPARALV
jgi:hypothetical protein